MNDMQPTPGPADPVAGTPVESRADQSTPVHPAQAATPVGADENPQPTPTMPPPALAARVPNAPISPTKAGFAHGFGTGFGVAAGLGAIVVVLSLIGLVTALIGGGLSGLEAQKSNTLTTVWGPDAASNQLLALSVSGAIETTGGGTSFSQATYGYELAAQIDELEADDHDGLVLLMDTPGGTIAGARAIAEAVDRYQDRTGHKVMAYVQSMSASGGMYAMAPADLVIADHGTFIGSIGVIMGPFEQYRDVTAVSGTLLTPGVTTNGGITSEYLTEGTGKDFGNPWREMTEAERAHYQAGLAIEYQNFVDFVATHRGIDSATIVNDLGAHLFDAQTAIDKGLVDEIAGRSAAFTRAAEVNGLDPSDTKVVAPQKATGLAALLGAEQRVWGHNVPLSSSQGLRPTSELCTGAPTVLAVTGDLSAHCGA